MASIKCPRCGLVNWIDSEVCKRCKSPLVQIKQTPGTHSTTGSKEPGAALSVCGVCGDANDLATRNITRTLTPHWVWLFLPLGILPAGILGLVLQVKHSFSLPLCRKCTARRGWAGVISWASIVVCVFVIIIAIGVGLQTRSWVTFVGLMAIAATVAFFSGWFDKKANPRYVTFTRDLVEIDVPGKGRLLVVDKRQFEATRL
jgi:ribosomal protein L40E